MLWRPFCSQSLRVERRKLEKLCTQIYDKRKGRYCLLPYISLHSQEISSLHLDSKRYLHIY